MPQGALPLQAIVLWLTCVLTAYAFPVLLLIMVTIAFWRKRLNDHRSRPTSYLHERLQLKTPWRRSRPTGCWHKRLQFKNL